MTQFRNVVGKEAIAGPKTLIPVRAFACCILSVAGLTPATAADTSWNLHDGVNAPKELKLSGSIRARYESLDGQARAGLPPSDELASLRTTLFAEYATGPWRIGGELYDSRAYLGEAGGAVSTAEVNALELVQAYVARDWKNVLDTEANAGLQVGRFTLNIGSRRLISADDYRNTTNGYTGARLDVRAAGGTATLLYTMPQRRLPDDQPALLDNDIEFDEESSDLVLWGGMVTTPKFAHGAALDLTYLRLDERDSADLATRDRHLDTGAVRLFRDPAPGRADYEFEVSYQTGSVRASTAPTAGELDAKGRFAHLEMGYQWKGRWDPRLSFEYDYASGDGSEGRYERYDTLFGTRRPDFGPSGIYSTVGRANISAPGVRLELADARVDALVDYRALWLDSSTDSFSTSGVRDASGQSGKFAGHQLDTRLRYWIVPKALRFETDMVLLKKGRFLKDAPNSPSPSDSFYVSVNLTAMF